MTEPDDPWAWSLAASKAAVLMMPALVCAAFVVS
jgi:hypothetical protein